MPPTVSVSVLMPVRDAAGTLDEAVESILGQTLDALELVAVDDGSEDGSADRLRAWERRDDRVRVERRPSGGIVAALEHARTLARADLLARMDADDVAEPERLERQVALLDERPEVVACGTGVRYFPESLVKGGARRYAAWLNGLHEPGDLERDLFVECPIAHPTLVARREALERAGGWRDPGWPEDYDLVLRLWAGGGALANVPAVLHRWRESPDRLSRTHSRYAPAAFRRCKVHHLGRTLLAGWTGVVVWGAGPTGKAFSRALQASGHPVRAFVDVDPRKIGQEIHGAPVVRPEESGRWPDAFCVGAVGSARGRQQVRAALEAVGRTQMTDFVVVA